MIEGLLASADAEGKRAFYRFLASGIDYLAQHYPAHWGVTLFADAVRLNGGWVECLVLDSEGVVVLVAKSILTPDIPVEGRHYRNAPGCDLTRVLSDDLQTSLPSLETAHHSAILLSAKRDTTAQIRAAHSPGVLKFLATTLNRSIASPSYVPSDDVSPIGLFDESAPPTFFTEGGRCTVLVNRFERNSQARGSCLAHYGLACAVCGMTFGRRYGGAMEGMIHVHHLVPLSSIGADYEVNPIADLRPVCPNCHAVIHRSDPPLSIDDAKALLIADAV